MQRRSVVILLALLVTAVGLVAIFALIAVLQLLVLGGLRVGRRAVGVRADLATWIDEQAAATGEPAARITDRAVASYRAGLSDVGPRA
jgi:hypothetical protein